MRLYVLLFFFFFQAEDGIRDLTVTGVQTCALPISVPAGPAHQPHRRDGRGDLRAPATAGGQAQRRAACGGDRKSTRLNSSHSQISYAVFCLKKKTKETYITQCCVEIDAHVSSVAYR